MNQAEMIHNYAKEHRMPFNKYLFTRNTMDIIEELKNVIQTCCHREGYFTIRVESFEVIEEYSKIIEILHDYEENTKSKNKKKENPYDYIDLKDSDICLLVVNYFIGIGEEYDRITVYIAVPRIVDKYYFRIGGNIYSAMYQVVDGSTYNNATSNAKSQSITLKTVFMPTRIYKSPYTLKTTDKQTIKAVRYSSRIFNKMVPGMKYIFAKYGYYGAMDFFGVNCIYLSTKDPHDSNMYTFARTDYIYISVPKMIFDNEPIVQSLVCTIICSILKDTSYTDIFTNEFWVKSLGLEFNSFTVEKGESIKTSIESIYDTSTKNSIRLPEEEKFNIYAVLRWMMREFAALRAKDNLDISTKKIRYAEYIAALYAMKISRGIYRVSDLNKRATIDSIKKAISTQPTYLLKQITKCKLVNYRNMVNDQDALTALKFTYKGTAGLGENNSNSIPDIYRHVHISHIGRVDMDSSSATDPGVTGTLCPLNDLYNGSFSDFQEPNSWEAGFNKLIDEYNSLNNISQLVTFMKEDEFNKIDSIQAEFINGSIAAMTAAAKYVSFCDITMDDDNENHVFYDPIEGMEYYEL